MLSQLPGPTSLVSVSSYVTQIERGDQIAALSLGAACLALVISIWQWLASRRRGRHMATLEFWTTTQDLRYALRGEGGVPYEHDDAFDRWIEPLEEHYRALSEGQPSTLAEEHQKRDHLLRRYLDLIETLGAGANAGTFDLRIIQRLDGPRILALWSKVGTYVDHRRNLHDPLKYRELEIFAGTLRSGRPVRR